MNKRIRTHGFVRAAFIAALGLGAASIAGPAFASPTYLMANNSITSGAYTIKFTSGSSTAGADFATWQMVAVPGGFTIESGPGGGPILTIGAPTNSHNDATLNFTVTANSGGISVDYLSMVSSGDYRSVGELISYSGGSQNSGVINSDAQTPITLGGSYTQIQLTKDLNVTSLGATSTITSVTQLFEIPTPEPAGLTVLGVGLLGLAFALRRRRVQ